VTPDEAVLWGLFGMALMVISFVCIIGHLATFIADSLDKE
jgi:hypothetical protein